MSIRLKWGLRVLAGLILIVLLVLAFNWSKIQRLMRVNSLFSEQRIVGNFSDMQGMFFNTEMPVKSDTPTPLPKNPRPMPDGFSFRGETMSFTDWQSQRAVTAMVVLKDGQIAYEGYFKGTAETDRRISWSVAKSFLSAAFGVAVNDGLVASLDSPVTDYVPDLKGTAYDGASIRNVLNMASGVKFNEDYLDFGSDINKMGRVLALGKSMDGFAQSLSEKARPPGSRRQYVSIDTHVLGMVLRAATGQSVIDYLSAKILKPLGLEADVYYVTDGYGTAFVLGGLNMRTRDYARFGLMMAQNGQLNGVQIVPADWVAQSTANSAPEINEDEVGTDNAELGYGFQWWLPPNAEKGEFFAIGVYGQYVYVNQAENVVVALNSANLTFSEGDGKITLSNLEMFRQIVNALKTP
jgi:CubicO group peptidase (beta-lactamase class C family)